MHDSSYETMRAFVRTHLASSRGRPLEILDFGSQVVGDQHSYRPLLDDPNWTYRGLDIEQGNNVDIVVADAYDWHEVPSESVDLVISGQAFEHVEYFWASIFEIVRVLKTGGLAAIIAPSGGFEHRFPVDCWRFYRDGFDALARYVGCDVVDSFTDWGNGDWADSILVVQRPGWSTDDRRRFAQRAEMQRMLISPEPVDATLVEAAGEDLGDAAPTSILANVQVGALSTELGSLRAERLARESEAAARAAGEQAAALDERIEEHARQRATERINELTPLRVYGKARGAVAGVVGDRGRQLYKRLRGRP